MSRGAQFKIREGTSFFALCICLETLKIEFSQDCIGISKQEVRVWDEDWIKLSRRVKELFSNLICDFSFYM